MDDLNDPAELRAHRVDGGELAGNVTVAMAECHQCGNSGYSYTWPYVSGHPVGGIIVDLCDECWRDLLADQSADQPTEIDRLRAELAAAREREAALADALPFLREVAGAHLSLVDEDDVIIKVSPGRAAWAISRARALLARTAETDSAARE